jgi:hypothetical protein
MLRYACAAALLLLPATAFAHSDINGPHGGDVEDANPGPFHIETAAKGNMLSVFITDQDGNPSPSAGVTGSAVVLVNKVKTPVTLAPVSGNQLQGTGDFTAAPDMRVLVTLTIDGQAQKALFSPQVQP